jgi:hypothetical protein
MGSQPTPATGFRVLSMGRETPVPASGPCDWGDNLCEPSATNVQVGTSHFDGAVQGGQVTCTGWITLTQGSGWKGTVNLSGTLHLVGGQVGEGDLAVVSSTTPVTFQTVHVDRVNPKRYTAV